MKKSELRQLIREEVQKLQEAAPTKMDTRILSLLRKIKKHPEFSYVKSEPHVVRRVRGKDVKRVFGVDMDKFWKEVWNDDERMWGWVDKHGSHTSDIYTIGYERGGR